MYYSLHSTFFRMTTCAVTSAATRPAIVIVSGSRTWPDPQLVEAELERCERDAGSGRKMILVHGACKLGVDAVAKNWALKRPNWTELPYYPDWDQYRLSAGVRRNKEMIDENAPKAFAMLAFCFNESKGTENAIEHMMRHDRRMAKTRVFRKNSSTSSPKSHKKRRRSDLVEEENKKDEEKDNDNQIPRFY